ncbi:MAG: hypothetical protein EOP48_25730, partial [Sphingobacteriales bacterium]
MLEKFVAVMDANPTVSLVTCDKEVFHAKSFVTRVAYSHLHDGRKALLNTLNDHCWIGEPSSVMFNPSKVTESDSRLSRRPPQSSQGRLTMYCA